MVRNITLTQEEAYFLEKILDDQKMLLMNQINRTTEQLIRADLLIEDKKEIKNPLKSNLQELERSTKIVDSLRSKLEELRK